MPQRQPDRPIRYFRQSRRRMLPNGPVKAGQGQTDRATTEIPAGMSLEYKVLRLTHDSSLMHSSPNMPVFAELPNDDQPWIGRMAQQLQSITCDLQNGLPIEFHCLDGFARKINEHELIKNTTFDFKNTVCSFAMAVLNSKHVDSRELSSVLYWESLFDYAKEFRMDMVDSDDSI